MCASDMRLAPGEGRAAPFARVFVTDRLRCVRPLPEQVGLLAAAGLVDAVLLRERDLDERSYERLAREVGAVCARARIAFAIHGRVEVARRTPCDAVHLPLPQLREEGRPRGVGRVGTNVHALSEVREAEALGADALIACPVFAPSCKPASTAKGLRFVRDVVRLARVPVLALGGIDDVNEPLIRAIGAAGACRMADFARRFDDSEGSPCKSGRLGG